MRQPAYHSLLCRGPEKQRLSRLRSKQRNPFISAKAAVAVQPGEGCGPSGPGFGGTDTLVLPNQLTADVPVDAMLPLKAPERDAPAEGTRTRCSR